MFGFLPEVYAVRKQRRGYTLFELVLVLAMLILMAALAFPTLDSMNSAYRVTEAVDMVRARWATARTYAMNEGRAYRFSVLPNKGNFRIAPDGIDYWSGGGGNTDENAYVLDEALPKGVRFNTSDSANGADTSGESSLQSEQVDISQMSTIVTFLPDGTAGEDVEITFSSSSARPVKLKLRALTGAVTVKTVPMEIKP